MEEYLDILDEETGDLTGEVILKKEAQRTGVWHGAIHLIIVNKDRTKTLLQKRCAKKILYPNMWDMAVGGHITAGETALSSAQRELQEELGLDYNEFDLKLVDRVKEKLNNGGIICNEYVSIFLTQKDVDISDIELQEDEVSEVKWVNKDELNQLKENNMFLPHTRVFEIMNELLVD